MKLRVITNVGQILYMDGKRVGKNRYDHSDFNWKNCLEIGYSHDIGRYAGWIKNVYYRRI